MTTIPRRRTRAIVTGFVAAVALVLATAAPAGATPVLSPSGPYDDLDVVSISGTAPTGATHFAVAQCNVTNATTDAELGEACHITTALAPAELDEGTYDVDEFVLRDGWSPNWDLSSGSPTPVIPSSTSCDAVGGDDCAIVVSFYGGSGFITAQSAATVFNA